MSHFAVIVFGDDVEKQLAPYHEFECTGIDDEFVKDIDKTEELRSYYERLTLTKLKDQNGNLFDPWDDMFYRDPTTEEIKKYNLNAKPSEFKKGIDYCIKEWGDGKGCYVKVKYIPDGYEKIEVKNSELETFAEYCEFDGYDIVKFGQTPNLKDKHKYGYTLLDKDGEVIKVIDRTNPNAKWDYWLEGGRYSGCWDRKDKKGHFVSGKLKEIDFEGEEYKAEIEATNTYDRAAALYPPMKWTSFKNMIPLFSNREDARKAYFEQEGVKMLNKSFSFLSEIDMLLLGRNAYIQYHKNRAGTPYAFIKNGKWYARGEMGWWGISSNENEDAFNRAFKQAVAETDPETRITLIDCHI